ncbi:MAG TPA: SDR family NAD(P)-dependent oxidoreductase, partial [Ktedonobacterales bacterium]|nr:SDR family NAD(P)-dependent oxidoreductase [Ktedonobacterales bacterium]
MLQVNIIALTELTRLVLPQMVARKRGKVMLLASTAAFQPGPGMAVYAQSAMNCAAQELLSRLY